MSKYILMLTLFCMSGMHAGDTDFESLSSPLSRLYKNCFEVIKAYKNLQVTTSGIVGNCTSTSSQGCRQGVKKIKQGAKEMFCCKIDEQAKALGVSEIESSWLKMLIETQPNSDDTVPGSVFSKLLNQDEPDIADMRVLVDLGWRFRIPTNSWELLELSVGGYAYKTDKERSRMAFMRSVSAATNVSILLGGTIDISDRSQQLHTALEYFQKKADAKNAQK